MFGDDNFIGTSNVGYKRISEFCMEIEKRNLKIKFGIECRVSDVNLKSFRMLKDVGLSSVMLGIENGSQKTLERWNKNIKVEDSIEAIKIVKKLNIKLHSNYILLDMDSTLEDIKENYDFIESCGLHRTDNPIHLFNNYLGIYPKTMIEEKLRTNGRLRRFKATHMPFEELECINEYESMYSYDIVDRSMAKFIYFNNFWIETVEKKYKKLKSYDKINKIIGSLYMQLFKMCIEYAEENKDYETGKRILYLKICDFFDKHLE